MCHRQNDLIRGTKVIMKYGIYWLEHINFKFLSPCKHQRIKLTAKHISLVLKYDIHQNLPKDSSHD